MNYNNILNFSVRDFLEYCRMNAGYRFVGLITDRQMTTLSSDSYVLGHWELISKLGSRIFPDLDCSYYAGDLDQYIAIFGIKDSISFALPDSISLEQYEIMVGILDEVKKYQDEHCVSVMQIDYDDYLKKLQSRIVDNKESISERVVNEDIVGVSLGGLLIGDERLIPSDNFNLELKASDYYQIDDSSIPTQYSNVSSDYDDLTSDWDDEAYDGDESQAIR